MDNFVFLRRENIKLFGVANNGKEMLGDGECFNLVNILENGGIMNSYVRFYFILFIFH